MSPESLLETLFNLRIEEGKEGGKFAENSLSLLLLLVVSAI